MIMSPFASVLVPGGISSDALKIICKQMAQTFLFLSLSHFPFPLSWPQFYSACAFHWQTWSWCSQYCWCHGSVPWWQHHCHSVQCHVWPLLHMPTCLDKTSAWYQGIQVALVFPWLPNRGICMMGRKTFFTVSGSSAWAASCISMSCGTISGWFHHNHSMLASYLEKLKWVSSVHLHEQESLSTKGARNLSVSSGCVHLCCHWQWQCKSASKLGAFFIALKVGVTEEKPWTDDMLTWTSNAVMAAIS